MERRTFLKNVTAVSAFTFLKPETVFGTNANSAIRVGIIGCGGRGSSAISSMSRNTNTNIIAMADLFEDKLQNARGRLNQLNTSKGFPEIRKSNIYQGSKAYLELINNKDVDAVLISSPCYTHPEFMEAAVAAGKHIYCEKPAAVDVDGCLKVERLGKKINGKLSLVFGFQIRSATPYVEMVKRIQRKDIGDVINAQLYYLSSGIGIHSFENISYDEVRIRNHFHFKALSGGSLLDQGVHMLDVCNWALQGHPLRAIGTGGTKGRPDFGDVWSNYQVLYEYPNNVNVSFHSTQIGQQFGSVCARFIGTKGIAEAHYTGGVFINGENQWDSGIARVQEKELTYEQRAAGVFLSSLHDADENKVKSFIRSIETGNHLNEIQEGSTATLTAILGRNAAKTNAKMTWDAMLLSNEKIDPMLNLSQFD